MLGWERTGTLRGYSHVFKEGRTGTNPGVLSCFESGQGVRIQGYFHDFKVARGYALTDPRYDPGVLLVPIFWIHGTIQGYAWVSFGGSTVRMQI